MIAIETIQQHVAASFGVALIEMTSDRRSRAVARPRQVAMYLAKELTGRSLPVIGHHFGRRDHTTVLAGIRRVCGLLDTDSALAGTVATIRGELESEPENV